MIDQTASPTQEASFEIRSLEIKTMERHGFTGKFLLIYMIRKFLCYAQNYVKL